MKILHFADAHIDIAAGAGGKQDPVTGLPVRAMDFLSALSSIVDAAINERVDMVIFAGDAYKDRSPNPTYQREWGRQIVRLSQAGIPTLLLTGNHDISPSVARAHTLQEFSTLKVPNVKVIDRPMLLTPADLGVPLQVLGLPWISKAGLMTNMGGESANIDEVLSQMEHQLEKLVQKLVERLDPAIPTVLASHAAVRGAKLGAERSLSLGAEMTLNLNSLVEDKIDYVALGHIHLAQDLNEGSHPPVIYPGSIERLNFGEAGDDKFFVIADVNRGSSTVDWRKINTRPFIDKSVTINVETEDPNSKILKALGASEKLKDAVVRLTINFPKDMEAQIDEEAIRRHAKEALEFHLSKRAEAKQRIRLPDVGIESMSPAQLLDVYLKNIRADNMEELAQLGAGVFAEAQSTKEGGQRDG
jgi:exonuclease SbcD